MSYAQTGSYGTFDFELGFEIPAIAASHPGKTNTIVPFLYAEGRWQLDVQPVDVGFHIGMSVIKRKFADDYENYRAVPILATGNYQFGRGTRFNPYVGLGAGVSINTIVNHWSGGNNTRFALSPRVGIRCYRF